MRVSEVMTRAPKTVTPSTSLKEAARTMLEHGISGLPVLGEGGELVGIITEADFVARQVAQVEGRRRLLDVVLRKPELSAGQETVGEAMSRVPVTVGPDATVTEAARRMVANGVKRLPVVDLEKKLIGIVSRADIMAAFTRSDAAIETEIRDGILQRMLFLEPSVIEVSVTDGVVALKGELTKRSDVRLLSALTERVDGVVRIDDRLTWRQDDTIR